MSKISIEFFHDVICSFCFPMSYRMRQLEEMRPDLEIVHRSFALIWEESDFDKMFGSREEAKMEIVTHWEHANRIDDLHRFNIAGMKESDFPFPTSVKGLLACKAAYFAGGNSAYWDLFDALQDALFVRTRNIGDQGVIDDLVRQSGIDFAAWQKHYGDPKTKEAVEGDLLLVEQYGVTSVPHLVINGKHHVRGALPLARIIRAIDAASDDSE